MKVDPRVWRRLSETLERLRRRNKDLATRIAQLEQSRAKWREKALDRQRALERERVRSRQQRLRAELWKHRALVRAER